MLQHHGTRPTPSKTHLLMRYRLRTLLIVLAIGPPLLAGIYYVWVISLGAGAPGSLFGPPPLQHYGRGPTSVNPVDLANPALKD